MKKITIDPVTRIEGHAKIDIYLDDDGRVADRDREIKFLLLLVHHEQRPGIWFEVSRDLIHDGLQNGIQIQR